MWAYNLSLTSLDAGTLHVEAIEEIPSNSALIAGLDNMFRLYPKRLLPKLYTANGQEFPGYIVELQTTGNLLNFRIAR